MNRVCIVLTDKGEIADICADEPIEVFTVDPSVPHDRVYRFGVQFGPQHVQKHIGGYAVGHQADGTLGDGDGTGKHPPSKPHLGIVK